MSCSHALFRFANVCQSNPIAAETWIDPHCFSDRPARRDASLSAQFVCGSCAVRVAAPLMEWKLVRHSYRYRFSMLCPHLCGFALYPVAPSTAVLLQYHFWLALYCVCSKRPRSHGAYVYMYVGSLFSVIFHTFPALLLLYEYKWIFASVCRI